MSSDTAQRGHFERARTAAEVVHACPEGTSGVTGCCGLTPFELAHMSRMTLDPSLVTCTPSPSREDLLLAARLVADNLRRESLQDAIACAIASARCTPLLDRAAKAEAAVETAAGALELIDRHGCENYTDGTRCFDDNSGRTRGAEYGAEAWCAPCIAADVLSGGTS